MAKALSKSLVVAAAPVATLDSENEEVTDRKRALMLTTVVHISEQKTKNEGVSPKNYSYVQASTRSTLPGMYEVYMFCSVRLPSSCSVFVPCLVFVFFVFDHNFLLEPVLQPRATVGYYGD